MDEKTYRSLLSAADADVRGLISVKGYSAELGWCDSPDWSVREYETNYVVSPKGMDLPEISFSAVSFDNVVILTKSIDPRALISVDGSSNLIHVNDSVRFSARVSVHGNNNCLFSGRSVFAANGMISLRGHGTTIIIGDECSLLPNFSISTGDSNVIFDLSSLDVLNAPSSVVLEPHVLLEEAVVVSKGITIGEGSVVGTGSNVQANIPRFSLAKGNPAVIVREGVSWSRGTGIAKERLRMVKRRLVGV